MKIYSANQARSTFNQPVVMAILNATPDSFSGDGLHGFSQDSKLQIAEILASGAEIIDIGGESTRPGHEAISVAEEARRVIEMLRQVRQQSTEILISIDTQKAEVAKLALEAGADFINDISSLKDAKMPNLIKESGCSLVVMRNQPLQTQIVKSCKEQIETITKRAQDLGIENDCLIIDPGLGFGSLEEQEYDRLPGGDLLSNLELTDQIDQYSGRYPVLIGASRKRFIGQLMNQKRAKDRDEGSLALAILAMQRGASIVRVHNAKATMQAKAGMLFPS
ncbi:dihydropteroate synthase [Candidatus Saccharibacteria bacterium]|jgi:dihydropteroate synthase|nr:dihydropteroate synthase [Candidatus Saccharibacteria bacterium]